MNAKTYTEEILKELSCNLDAVDEGQLERLCDEILKAGHIFTAGCGRSGTAAAAFANRLMHLGFSVSRVGDMTSPHSKAGDLLIISSGSGETESLLALARKAKKNHVRTALVTMGGKSSIASYADTVVVLPGASPKLKDREGEAASIQPMGSAFEQLSFLVYDGIVLELMDRLHETSESMFMRHADLE